MIPLAATNLTLFFGHFHPLMVHLPIGFLATLAVLELADRIHHFKHAAQARGVILLLTLISSVLAVVLGLMLASSGGYDPHLLAWHKWSGIALATSCCLTAIAYWSKHHRPYVGLLMLTLLILTPAAHFGGSMTHGSDYLTEYAPNWIRTLTMSSAKPTPSGVRPTTRPKLTDPAQAVVYADLIQPVFQKNCLSCHGPEKMKGEFRLDTFAALQKGGRTGPAIAAGKPAADALLIQRLLLPVDDTQHMPPAGRPQPTDDQLALLQWWVDTGASPTKKVADLNPPLAIADIITTTLGIAPSGPPTTPLAYDDIAPQIAAISGATGAVITRIAPNLPLLNVNAAPARAFADADLAQLAPIARNILSLSLAGTKVTDAGLALLADMPNLERLRLERTAVTDAGLAPLAKLRKLSYLNLYSTNVTEAALPTLKYLPALRSLYVWKTKITPAAAEAFAAAKTDQTKIDRLRTQIASLQSQIQAQTIQVVEGIASPTPTTAPAVAKAPMAATTPAVAATKPATTAPAVAINTICPVSGKPIDPTKFLLYKGKRVAFCCDICPKDFQKDPAKYESKLALAAPPK